MDRESIGTVTEKEIREFFSELPPLHQALAKAQIRLVRNAIRVADDKGSIGIFLAGTLLSMTKVLARLAAEEAAKGEQTTMSQTQSALMTTMVFALAMCDEFPETPTKTPKQQAN